MHLKVVKRYVALLPLAVIIAGAALTPVVMAEQPDYDETDTVLNEVDDSVCDLNFDYALDDSIDYGDDDVVAIDSVPVPDDFNLVAHLFTVLPDDVVPLLPQSTRLDMADYAKAGMKRPVKNKLGGYSEIDSLTEDYLHVNITTASNLAMAILKDPKDNDKDILAVVYSVTPRNAAADSQLLLFTTSMVPLETGKYFTVPTVADFLAVPKNVKENTSDLARLVTFPAITYSLEPPSTIIARLTSPQMLPLEIQRQLEPYQRPELRYVWNGKRFKLSN